MKPVPAFFDLDADKKWLADFERELDQAEQRAKRKLKPNQEAEKQLDKSKKVAH